MNNRLLHAQNIVPVHPVEYILPENLDALPELPMTNNGDGTYYCEGMSTQETSVIGKNLFDLKNAPHKIINNGLFDSEAYRLLTIENPGTYTISSKKDDIYLTTTLENGVMTQIYKRLYAGTSYTFVATGNDFKMCMSKIGDKEWTDLEEIQLESGETATEYEEFIPNRPSPDYPSQIVNTYPASTYKAVCGDKTYKVVLDDDLRSIGDTADRLWIDTRKWMCWVGQNINIKMLNGSEKIWYTYQDAATKVQSYHLQFRDCKKSYQSSLCSHFKNINAVWISGQQGCYSDHASNQDKYFVSDKTTLEEWKDYLAELNSAGTPVTVQYTLKDTVDKKMDLTEVKVINAGSGIEGTVNDAVDVLRVYGKSRQNSTSQGKNLFDLENAPHKYIYNNKLVDNEIYRLLKITKPGTYTISSNTNLYLTTKLEDGVATNIYIRLYTGTSYTFSVTGTDFAICIKISGGPEDIIEWTGLEKIQLEEGKIATDYEPFVPDSPSPIYSQPIESVEGVLRSHGKNLIDLELLKDVQNWEKTDYDAEHPYYGYPHITVQGFEIGKEYTIMVDSIPDIGESYYLCIMTFLDDVNKQVTWIYHRVNASYNHTLATFTAKSTEYYINCAGIGRQDTVDKFMQLFPNLRIYEGKYDTLQPYERYRGNTITLPTLRGLPDGTRDVLTIDRTQKRAWVERKVGIHTVNTALWADWETGKRVILSAPGIKTPQYIGDCIGFCNIAKGIKNLNLKGFSTIKPYKAIYWYPDAANFGLTGNETRAEANAVLQEFLSDTPFVCTYALAEPVIEEIPWTDDLLLLTNQYYTSITADSDLDPDMELTLKILGNR